MTIDEMRKNIVFLDFDGVVNTPIWSLENGKYDYQYNFPEDGKVNNWQAVQWVSQFCLKYGYSIVVISTWRSKGLKRCAEYLRNGGLRDGIEVVGVTPRSEDGYRGREIKMWLDRHPAVNKFVIFDDDSDMEPFMDRLVKCRSDAGFLEDDFVRARTIHEAFDS